VSSTLILDFSLTARKSQPLPLSEGRNSFRAPGIRPESAIRCAPKLSDWASENQLAKTRAFLGTNPTNEPITAGLPLIRPIAMNRRH
jgi:hypothetical protein